MFLITLVFVIFQGDGAEGQRAEANAEALKALETPFADICRNTFQNPLYKKSVSFDKELQFKVNKLL
jgi:hypothetical protein